MKIERVVGNADKLQKELEKLLEAGKTIEKVIPTLERGVYLIIYS